MDKTLRNKIIIIAAALLFCGALLAVYFTVVVPPKSAGEKTLALEIVYSDKEYTYENIVTKSETVFELLKEFDKELSLGLDSEESAYGAFVKGLKGTAQDEAKGFYYRFLISGTPSQVGASAAAIKDGDTVRFEYGYTTYGEDWSFVSFDLKPSADGSAQGVSGVYRSPAQIAVIIVSAVIAAAAVAVTAFTLVKDRKSF